MILIGQIKTFNFTLHIYRLYFMFHILKYFKEIVHLFGNCLKMQEIVFKTGKRGGGEYITYNKVHSCQLSRIFGLSLFSNRKFSLHFVG